MTIYSLSRSFKTSVERTPRVLEVAESFGLGLSDKEFTLYDELELDIRASDVVYITGQSGSGKSMLLKDLAAEMRKDGLKVVDLNEVELKDKPVIELVGKNVTEATEILSRAGISDAWIFLRKPSELSDGQRYRLKLALVMEADADVWIADEFGAVLDRVTAKSVAYNMAKVARRQGKTFMVATTHDDMTEELAPSVFIEKLFNDRIEVLCERYEEEDPPQMLMAAE
ncbi:ATP-binding cassette domain-containing protein [Paracoccus litorisediminis]|uniref:ATP-binding cassette domain-containing protein n=1 Tax=Paracoccus litorisediminis TaxID=2006130 RepID=A0A844HQ48_9RHOB|nr:ATP-binding cassette domain-containing protein [Paracoccus litorisediminis]MTH61188.1 ATP-binding cassette domain-containing protein [Paracoccus litorisediminis]